VFSPSILVGKQHVAEFIFSGIDAAILTGSTPDDERAATVERFRSGALRVLVNVGLFREGFDAPICGAVILARGAGTAGTMIQMATRAGRPYPGKERAVFVDLRGVTHDLGSPIEDRAWSLDGRAWRKAGDQGDQSSYCLVCGAIVNPGTACEECGHVTTPKPIRVTNDPLVKFAGKRAETADQRAATLARWLDQAAEKGWKDGHALFRFKATYGNWPTIAMRAAAERMRRRTQAA
jgi:superfamily II DNA or RNA helicase